ncbi:MAG: 4-(cytidine 5'-diphospho)-2-C-methyl-D-erythritol kinase [Alphaproteobacteria bacterium]
MKIRAPAKINVRLRVVGKRRDGYHLLDTIIVPISLYDDIEICQLKVSGEKGHRQGPRIEVTCDHPSVPSGEKNLVYRAARAFLQTQGLNARLRIRIRKRIPVGAGLGGGSSDAGATLLGLNQLFKPGLSSKNLQKLAIGVGADVPFFLARSPARVRGIGERVTVLRRLPRSWLVVLYPGFEVSTAWVYANYRPTLTKRRVNTSIPSSLRSCKTIAAMMVNDLEAVTMRRYPVIGLLKEELARRGAVGVLMTGSGSSVFGLFDNKRNAQRAFRGLRKKGGSQAFLARILG